MSKSKRQNRTKTLIRTQKKTWHTLLAPALFGQQHLGQSLVAEGAELLGKVIAANAMNVTGDMKKQQVTLVFKVTNVKDGQGNTEVEAYEINPAYIKRMVRRNKNKLDLSFIAHTKDNVRVRIKPTLMTKSRASGGVCAALRKKAQDSLVKLVKTMLFEEIIRDLLTNRLQNTIKSEVKKIYPVKIIEMRIFAKEIEKTPGREENKEVAREETKEDPREGLQEAKAEVKETSKPKRKTKPKQETPPAEQQPAEQTVSPAEV